MTGVNKVILIGNLGRDPEVRHLEGGAIVAKFPLATTEIYKTKDGQRVEQTEWHNIVMWRSLAESAEKFLRKGSLIYLEGKIRTRTWEGQDGVRKSATEIVGDTMTLLNFKRPDDASNQSNHQNETKPSASEESSSFNGPNTSGDDLPF